MSIDDSSLLFKEKHKLKNDEEQQRLNSLSISCDGFQTAPGSVMKYVEEAGSAISSTDWKQKEQEEHDRLEKMKDSNSKNSTKTSCRSLEFYESQKSNISMTTPENATNNQNFNRTSNTPPSHLKISTNNKIDCPLNPTQSAQKRRNSIFKSSQDSESSELSDENSKVTDSPEVISSELIRYLTDDDFDEPRVLIKKPSPLKKRIKELDFNEELTEPEDVDFGKSSCITQDEPSDHSQNSNKNETQHPTDSQGDVFFDAKEHFSCISEDNSLESQKTPFEVNKETDKPGPSDNHREQKFTDDNNDVDEDITEDMTSVPPTSNVTLDSTKNPLKLSDRDNISEILLTRGGNISQDQESTNEIDRVVSRIESPIERNGQDPQKIAQGNTIEDSDDSFPSVIEQTGFSRSTTQSSATPQGIVSKTPNQSIKPFQEPKSLEPQPRRNTRKRLPESGDDSLSQLMLTKNFEEDDQVSMTDKISLIKIFNYLKTYYQERKIPTKKTLKIENILRRNSAKDRRRIVKEWFSSW